MKTPIKVGILGATGYAGAELVRLLAGHPMAKVSAVGSVSFEGKKLSEVYPAYRGLCDLTCMQQDAVIEESDAVFAALPHGLSQDIAEKCDQAGKLFIDLGADFRLQEESEYHAWYGGDYRFPELHARAVYGLPELFREEIRGKRIIANPGCYTTAVPLALVPALQNGLIQPDGIIADCKSGVTGAGRGLAQNLHYAECSGSFTAYKVAAHRHTPEIEQTLSKISGQKITMTFVPHLLPVNRGILATCYARLAPGVTMETLREVYTQAYGGETFLRLLPEGSVANIRNVWYSNYCDLSLHLDLRAGLLIAVSAIDNMVKGAAGQAIQNMNLAMGIEETAGLQLVPPAF
ncbi:N-acetyl-gamma-glutamyl-phosphate reductase [Yeguia hominis]|uniref:N-acetyl-gamma-glutamyl-phosphate reductase n=1 Tax=Yeguia hominis TaxID=2763662 RepID=A0A926D9N6_9FIRM|nr:N-acetyl-gamma-glutamyl-phosphate reductase [Yeguia hominis]MBC8533354.1 N-acetyl-gamma-glutamyl-phosphate reductase [Yeguia hominis]